MWFYFWERFGIIKCAYALFSRTSGDVLSGVDGDVWECVVMKMFDFGFEENVWCVFDWYMSGVSVSGFEGASSEDVAVWAG